MKKKSTLKKDYRQEACGKLLDGYAGWGCQCCNPYGTSPNKMKPLARRRLRRVSKMALAHSCHELSQPEEQWQDDLKQLLLEN